jgi:phenylpyruvate tautomerase PptA (4-oxalocrotonate tautomerase family)
MPLLDVTIPEGALAPDAEAALLSELTDILLEHEGADPTNPVVRQIAWVYLHRPAQVYVAGAPAEEPRYRVQASVPEGQFDDERRAAIVAAVTDAVLRAEGIAKPTDQDLGRVWVFCHEVPDGTWGGAGRIARLADIVTLAGVEREKAERYAARRLAAARGHDAPVGTPA